MVSFLLRLPADLLARVRLAAHAERVSTSAFIRRVLAAAVREGSDGR